MKNYLIILLSIFAFSTTSIAQEKPNYKQAIENMKKLQDWIVNPNIGKLSEHIEYPLKRFGELNSIQDAEHFGEVWSTIFDEGVQEKIANISFDESKILTHYTGKFGFDNGKIWITSEGKITTINYQSDEEKWLNKRVTKKLQKQMDASVNQWVGNSAYIQNDKFIIRIDFIGDNKHRYASWSKPKTITDKPDLVLTGVDVDFTSSSGGQTFEFTSGDWLYEVSYNAIAGEDGYTGWLLNIYKSNKLVNTHKMKEVR